jgi:exodeoxyribonuclease VII large subunit
VHLRVLPVKVQGKEAATEIAAALSRAQDLQAQAIVLCRGGGSIEDLWAFNDEQVAEAIYRSTIPVVTGIGHETDATIADFCADYRCPTPTAAAERLIPDGIALRRQVSALRERLHLYLDHKVQGLMQRLRLQRLRLSTMGQRCSRLEFRLQLSEERLLQTMHEAMAKRERRLAIAAGELRRRLSTEGIDLRRRHLEQLSERLRHHLDKVIARKEGQLAQQASLLQGLSPLATLARGYAVVRTPSPRSDGRELVVETKEVEVGDRVDVYLRDGRLGCLVTAKARGDLAVPSVVRPQSPSGEASS